jgi:chromate reductase
MKLIAIVGSLRKDSVNRKAVRAFQEELPSGTEIEYAEIGSIPHYNQDDQEKSFPASVTKLAEQIKNADGVIFATPEYNYSVPGVLKNALDWVSRVPNQPFSGKTALIIGASPGNLGTARAQYHLRQIGVFLNINFLNRPEVMIGSAYGKFDESGKLTDASTREFLKKAGQALVDAIKNRT